MDNESTNATNKLVQNTLQKLGIELNKYRTGKKDHVTLKRLPKGYRILHQKQQRARIKGHPSGRIFRSTVQFMPHLQWLESRSKKSLKYNENASCICINCSQKEVITNQPVEEQATQARPLDKIVIESYAGFTFAIPLPEILQPNPSIIHNKYWKKKDGKSDR